MPIAPAQNPTAWRSRCSWMLKVQAGHCIDFGLKATNSRCARVMRVRNGTGHFLPQSLPISKLPTFGDHLSPFCIRSRKAVVQPQSLGMAHCAEMRILCPSLVLGSHVARRQQRNAGSCSLLPFHCPERHAWKRQYSRDASTQPEDDMKLRIFLLYHVVSCCVPGYRKAPCFS